MSSETAKKAFSLNEKTVLLGIVQDHLEVVVSKNRTPAVLEDKKNAWIEIGDKFNQNVDDSQYVSLHYFLLLKQT